MTEPELPSLPVLGRDPMLYVVLLALLAVSVVELSAIRSLAARISYLDNELQHTVDAMARMNGADAAKKKAPARNPAPPAAS